jgi:predicted CxxxxCH...CXXCH cytochrome family protein
VAGDTATTIAGVGAHDAHLAGATGGKEVKCAECHNVPDAASVLQVPHIDGIPRAEVVFNDTLARLVTGNGSYIPTAVAYDPASLRCSNTYCHGNWMATKSSAPIGMQFAYLAPDTAMRGGNVSPLWTGGAGEAVCGTCHALPPTGHLPAATNTCGSCHGEVVDNNLNIIDRSKHMNGKINAFASERAF